MKHRVEKLDKTNVEDLIIAINKVWDDVNTEVLESLIGSMEKRIQECIKVNGDHIDY